MCFMYTETVVASWKQRHFWEHLGFKLLFLAVNTYREFRSQNSIEPKTQQKCKCPDADCNCQHCVSGSFWKETRIHDWIRNFERLRAWYWEEKWKYSKFASLFVPVMEKMSAVSSSTNEAHSPNVRTEISLIFWCLINANISVQLFFWGGIMGIIIFLNYAAFQQLQESVPLSDHWDQPFLWVLIIPLYIQISLQLWTGNQGSSKSQPT